MKISLGIADDNQLFMKSLSALINTFPEIEVVIEAVAGVDLLKKMEVREVQPDVVLLDVSMPLLDGIGTAKAIAEKYPLVKMTALSEKDDEGTIINMIKAGCCAYLRKDIHADELEKAILEIYHKGYYNADFYNINYRRLIDYAEKKKALELNEREREFLQLATSDLTYKQIASQMHLSERTIDGYRDSIFTKLNVQSRVGMVLEGIRREWVVI